MGTIECIHNRIFRFIARDMDTIITNMLACLNHISFWYWTLCTNIKYETKQTVVVKKNEHSSTWFAYLYYGHHLFVWKNAGKITSIYTLTRTHTLTNTPTLLQVWYTSCLQVEVLHRSLQTTCHNNHLLMHQIFKRWWSL